MRKIICSILLALAIAGFTFDTANAYPNYDCNCSNCHSRADECAPVIFNTAPVADAGTDVTAFVGDTVSLDGSGSVDMDGDNLTYQWSLIQVPPGSNASLSNPTAVNPEFVMDTSGDYVARLVVSDGDLTSAPNRVTISTQNSAPVAVAGPDQTVFVGGTVMLDGINSDDVDGDLLSYTWAITQMPQGSNAMLSDTAAEAPTFDVDVAGTYVAQLIVSDGTVTSAPDMVTISTQNSAPVAVAGPDQTAFAGDMVFLDGVNSDDVDGDTLSYGWSLTAMPQGSNAMLSDAAAEAPTLEVDVAGTYVVQLIVSDGDLNSEPDTCVVQVDPVVEEPPVQEPPAQEPPPVVEPPQEEPPVIEPPKEEPPVVEPPKEEPPVIETPKDERPAGDIVDGEVDDDDDEVDGVVDEGDKDEDEGNGSLRRVFRNFRDGNYRQAIRDYFEANRSWIKNRWRMWRRR